MLLSISISLIVYALFAELINSFNENQRELKIPIYLREVMKCKASHLFAILALFALPFIYRNQHMWLLSAFLGYFLVNIYTDENEQHVYNITSIIMGIISFTNFFTLNNFKISKELIFSLGIFIILQLLLFIRFYGKGDAYMFITAFPTLLLFCPNSIGSIIWGLGYCLLSIIAFAIQNICMKNIKWNGKLKKPKAMTFSIALAFFMIIAVSSGL